MRIRTALVALCAIAAVAASTGCKKQGFVTTLQGTIFNAITGERIGGTDLKMYLQQGAITRQPDVFYTGKKKLGKDNATIDLMGDYVFTNIPSMDNISSSTTDPFPNEYRVTVIKDGFQRFEGIISGDMLANRDNVIRNIYLFPTDHDLPCYTFRVLFNGKPVPNAKVLAAPYATLSPGILTTDKWLSVGIDESIAAALDYFTTEGMGKVVTNFTEAFALFGNHYFFPAPGYLESLEATTDANGVASFCDFAAGAAYLVLVAPTEFEGIELLPMASIMVPGINPPELEINLFAVGQIFNPYGLYVKTASNQAYDSVQADGKLVVTFNRKISKINGAFSASCSGAVFDATTPVTATLSTDGLTLTLAPNFTTPPTATEDLSIYYGDGTATLVVDGYPDSAIELFDLYFAPYLQPGVSAEDLDEEVIMLP